MKLEIFAVHDVKAEAWLQPFFAMTVGVAVRMFEQACNEETHDMHRHAEDYTLFHVGTFHQDNGQIVPLEVLVPLGSAMQFRKVEMIPSMGRMETPNLAEEEVKKNGA